MAFRRFAGALLLASLSVAPACSNAASTAAESTVVINAGQSHGAGVVIAASGSTATIVTAKHVVNGDDLEVLGHGTSEKYAVLSVTSEAIGDDGLAYIVVRATDLAPVATGDQGALDAPVTVVGHPGLATYITARATTVYRYASDAAEVSKRGMIVVNCPTCAHGDSGGGVFDASGKLVAIVSSVQMINGKPQPFFFAIAAPR